MDEVVNRLARELADAIAAAVGDDEGVEACREKARAAGYELRVSLEAEIGFVGRSASETLSVSTPSQGLAVRPPPDMSVNDRRFLRSLRIAADEPAEEVE